VCRRASAAAGGLGNVWPKRQRSSRDAGDRAVDSAASVETVDNLTVDHRSHRRLNFSARWARGPVRVRSSLPCGRQGPRSSHSPPPGGGEFFAFTFPAYSRSAASLLRFCPFRISSQAARVKPASAAA
jgi:hypothetical protein